MIRIESASAYVLLALWCAGALTNAVEAKSDEELLARFFGRGLAGTQAGSVLQQHIAKNILLIEETYRPQCSHEALPVKFIERTPDGTTIEQWAVKSCEDVFQYKVAFKAPQGETGILVSPLFALQASDKNAATRPQSPHRPAVWAADPELERFLNGGVSETRADQKLQRDVAKQLYLSEAVYRPQCIHEATILGAKLVNDSEGGPVIEHWSIKSCGQVVSYEVTLVPTQTGGAYIKVHPLDTPQSGAPEARKRTKPARVLPAPTPVTSSGDSSEDDVLQPATQPETTSPQPASAPLNPIFKELTRSYYEELKKNEAQAKGDHP